MTVLARSLGRKPCNVVRLAASLDFIPILPNFSFIRLFTAVTITISLHWRIMLPELQRIISYQGRYISSTIRYQVYAFHSYAFLAESGSLSIPPFHPLLVQLHYRPSSSSFLLLISHNQITIRHQDTTDKVIEPKEGSQVIVRSIALCCLLDLTSQYTNNKKKPNATPR